MKIHNAKQNNYTAQKPKSVSLITQLLTSFLSVSIILICAVSGVFVMASYFSSNNSVKLNNTEITDFEETLKAREFDQLPVRRLVGSKGYIEITDSDANIVFSSLSDPNSYTVGEIDSIQKYDGGETIEVSGFETADDNFNYLVTKTSKNNDGETEQSYMLLSSDLRIISSTIATTKASLTQAEYDYFTYNYFAEGKKLYKYSFQADDYKTYNVILCGSLGANDMAPVVIVGSAILAAASLYAVFIVLYIRYMKRHVRRPVYALNDALNKIIANGTYGEQIDYKGYTEFELLTDSYNNLATLLNKSERERRELERDKQRMLAGLSHDLKTPITIIQGYAQALSDGVVKTEDEKKCLELISSKSDMMVELINTFYEYSMLEHPDFSLTEEIADVCELSRAYLAKKYSEITLFGFTLETDICENAIYCKLDKKQIERVFDNLIGNSLKYNSAGTAVFFSLKLNEENQAAFVIGDSGKGLPENMGDELFQPFVVGEKSRNKQGSGLGLAICKKIVTAHGGEISILPPSPPYATLFSILIPVSEAPLLQTEAENAADNHEIADEAAAKDNPKVEEKAAGDSFADLKEKDTEKTSDGAEPKAVDRKDCEQKDKKKESRKNSAPAHKSEKAVVKTSKDKTDRSSKR